MKNFSLIVLLIFFMGMSTSFLLHGDETPHGGIVVHANNGYNIERVHGIKRFFFYLLAEDERTTIEDKNLIGSVELILKDGSKEKYNLLLAKDSQTLKIIFKERKKIKSSVVHIQYKKKKITAKFD